MRENGMPLEVALTLHPRVVAQAGNAVVVERFLASPLRYYDTPLVAACSFHLAVIRYGKLEESIICRNYGELENTLMVNIPGGRELFYGNWWVPFQVQELT